MEDNNGKVAVVTGAAGGIGRVTAGMFAADGYTVLAVDLNDTVFEMAIYVFCGPTSVPTMISAACSNMRSAVSGACMCW